MSCGGRRGCACASTSGRASNGCSSFDIPCIERCRGSAESTRRRFERGSRPSSNRSVNSHCDSCTSCCSPSSTPRSCGCGCPSPGVRSCHRVVGNAIISGSQVSSLLKLVSVDKAIVILVSEGLENAFRMNVDAYKDNFSSLERFER
jgi:hypothetical protein